MVSLHSLAKFKTHLTRVYDVIRIPVQLTQFGLVVYVAIKQNGNPVFWLLIPFIVVLMALAWWFDQKVFFEAEANYTTSRTQLWNKLEQDVKAIRLENARMKKLLQNLQPKAKNRA